MPSTRRQGIFWIATVPYRSQVSFTALPEGVTWIKGQREIGEGGFDHWQFCFALASKGSLASVKRIFPANGHYELTKSEKAAEYVWKEDTRVPDSQFAFGVKPICRSSKPDWESIWTAAISGRIMDVPASIRIQSYRALRQIESDHACPVGMVRTCYVYWGHTGTGKSRRAWEEAGVDAYPKDPCTKFWCGYQLQKHVVIDEFRGDINIGHFLRWLDRYPVSVEIKGSSKPLVAEKIWITSNVNPSDWWPDASEMSKAATMRRMEIEYFPEL